ncbi:MAG: S1/P1 nuclease [Alistipes sp.]|nr:S1/P1 nuclease [Alistipes sp.]
MRRKLLMTLAIAVAVVVATLEVQAWGRDGHSAIAYMAEQHLTPQAREKCHHYLRHSLAYYASWQDHWRFTDPYKEIHYWHTSKVDAHNNLLENGGRAAYVQIERIRKEMKDWRSLDDSTIVVNLKLLIHMVGDMHCPSHTSYPDQPAYKDYNIYCSGKKTGFHKFWDASPSYLHKGWTCEDFHRNIDTMTRRQIAKIVKGTADAWERVNGAEMREVYKLIPHDAEYTALPEQDRKRAVEICELQMLRGAYRLAYVLNEIFKE